MNDKYLCEHLKKLISLMTSKKCFAYVNDKGKYVFGTKNNKNIVTKPVAIYLIINKILWQDGEKKEKKKIKRKRTKNPT